MSEYLSDWMAVVGASFGVTALGSYFVHRFRMAFTNKHIRFLEREVSLSRIREEQSERKLAEVMEAMASLQECTKIQLRSLKERVEELIVNLELPSDPYRGEGQKVPIELV